MSKPACDIDATIFAIDINNKRCTLLALHGLLAKEFFNRRSYSIVAL